ncbi:DUF2306 domain-containing protein [Aquimarina sp. 2304DJ70-9]|uniref:DUF2306 domain-containing protein n=1 Tax=Aquimarina penaris TaxID=3231044 RepID=UPI00346299E6
MIAINTIKNVIKKVSWGVMTFLAILMFLIASPYLALNSEFYFPQQKLIYIAHTTGIITHVACAMIAVVIGPFLFLPKTVTHKYINVHRWLGRIYLFGVLFGGISGLYMSTLAYGGPISKVGFATLAIFWILSGYFGYTNIRKKKILKHRFWMIRCYSLTFAAITLRLWLAGLQIWGTEFLDAYRTVAWLCWIPNLAIAECLVYLVKKNNF